MHNLNDAALYVILIVLMVLKFIYVVAWFMHLKFDSVLFQAHLRGRCRAGPRASTSSC